MLRQSEKFIGGKFMILAGNVLLEKVLVVKLDFRRVEAEFVCK